MATIEEQYVSLLADCGFKRISDTALHDHMVLPVNFPNCLFLRSASGKGCEMSPPGNRGKNVSAKEKQLKKAISDVCGQGGRCRMRQINTP